MSVAFLLVSTFPTLQPLGRCETSPGRYGWLLLHHNLEYGVTKSGHLEDWLVKKIFSICMQSKKFKKELMLKLKMISRTCLNFMIVFMVYE